MTALARSVAIETQINYYSTNLPITTNTPQTVYVQIYSNTPYFSTDQQNWYQGISWSCNTSDGAYALIITYNLAASGDELASSTTTNPTLWFSPMFQTSNQWKQIGYVPPLLTSQTITYTFKVGGYDPQIVVTPA